MYNAFVIMIRCARDVGGKGSSNKFDTRGPVTRQSVHGRQLCRVAPQAVRSESLSGRRSVPDDVTLCMMM
jgi:hypothetical protein